MKAIALVEVVTQPVYGTAFSCPPGAIARKGRGCHEHVFGGSAWTVSNASDGDHTLLFTWDPSDPLFTSSDNGIALRIPCFATVARQTGLARQAYRIDASSSRVEILERSSMGEVLELPFTIPIPPQPLRLTPMSECDYPVSKKIYWAATDRFVGGQDFIRVGGPPLWLYSAAYVTCECGRQMRYVCSLGYESDSPWSGLIPGHPVFFGEMAFYWLKCDVCNIVFVFSQST